MIEIMSPLVFRLTGRSAEDARAFQEAARIVRRGGLVAFPTETVYGLGADALNPEAIERLNLVKGRPPEKPYSWHLADAGQLREYVPSVPDKARPLIERFWPGPLTLVLPAADGRTIGFRLPDHPAARGFLAACKTPVAAPSANRSGDAPPTDAPGVLAALGESFDCLLDGGPTPLARESTVVSVAGGTVTVLREGAIPREQILAAVR